MYLIPIVVVALVVVVGAAWSPIFALLIAAPLFVLFLAYVGLSRRSDQQVTPPQASSPDRATSADDGEESGLWGERRP